MKKYIIIISLFAIGFILFVAFCCWRSFCTNPNDEGDNERYPKTKMKFKTWKKIFEFDESKWIYVIYLSWTVHRLFYNRDGFENIGGYSIEKILRTSIQVKMSFIDYLRFACYMKNKKKIEKLRKENENLLSIVQDTQDAIEDTKKEINGQFEYANHLMREATKNGRK